MSKTAKTTHFAYCTRVAPGCHSGPDNLGAVVSRHRTYELAVRAADRNDRLVVTSYDEDGPGGEVLYRIPAQGSKHGAGRYGNGLR